MMGDWRCWTLKGGWAEDRLNGIEGTVVAGLGASYIANQNLDLGGALVSSLAEARRACAVRVQPRSHRCQQ